MRRCTTFALLSSVLILVINCSQAPGWLTQKWRLVSYGTEPKGIMGHPFAEALGQRFYWKISGNTIVGYMQEGWQGTLLSLFSDKTEPKSDNFEKRTELKFKLISITSKECHIEVIEGTELYPLTSIVTPRKAIQGEIIVFRKLHDDMIAMDRKVNMDDNSIQANAGKYLMKESASLVDVDGETYHRLILQKPMFL